MDAPRGTDGRSQNAGAQVRPLPPAGDRARNVVERITALANGRTNTAGRVTLTAGATTTTISNRLFTTDGELFLTPRTANAAAAIATTFVTITAAGTATITHANSVSTDRTFGYEYRQP